MNNPTSQKALQNPLIPFRRLKIQLDNTDQKLPSPLRCLSGALLAGGLMIALTP